MVRCTQCRFLFEPPTRGLLPPCRQCGGVTVPVLKIRPGATTPSAPTMEIAVPRRRLARLFARA
jgi:hypothetical protein